LEQQNGQQQVEQQRYQRHRAPDPQRLALKQWPRMAAQRLALAAFQGQQPFLGSLEAMRRIGGHRAVHYLIEPDRQIRAVAAGRGRLAETRMLEGFDLATGIVASEELIERHAGGVEILLRAGRAAGEGLRGDVTGCAGQAMGLVAAQARAVGQAEIEDAQFAIVTEQNVLRLDVAVQDVASVQQAYGLDQPRRQVLPVCQAQWACLSKECCQGLSGVLSLYVIQVLALRQWVQVGEMSASDAPQEPFLLQQCRAGLFLVDTTGWQRL